MARIVYTISGVSQSFGYTGAWTGSLDLINGVNGGGTDERDQVPFFQRLERIDFGDGSLYNFTTNFNPYVSDNTLVAEYISFRNTTPTVKYPSTGRSFDIWSPSFAGQVALALSSWRTILLTNADALGQGVYALNPNKWTVLYDYSNSHAYCASKGGQIAFNFVA
jgi:hypothetical protein